MATPQELAQRLQAGIAAAKAGQRQQARSLLLDVVEQDQNSEVAWFWLYRVFDNHEDKRVCLENLAIINPNNEWAKQELLKYLTHPVPVQKKPVKAAGSKKKKKRSPHTPKKSAKSASSSGIYPTLITAFWVGISLMFLAVGIFASSEWLITNLRNRTFPDALTVFHLLELLIIGLFILTGMTGLLLAFMLHYRLQLGFYGSIFIGLGMLLVGPTISLIATPPNYMAMVCLGGVSGVIVLLTLASQSNFD